MISIETKGDYKNITKFLNKSTKLFSNQRRIEKYADDIIKQLMIFTPKDTSETANKWFYNIRKTKNGSSIDIYNSNVNDGVNIAIIIQYGHATKNGGWVEGIDYINPAIAPVVEGIINDINRELK